MEANIIILILDNLQVLNSSFVIYFKKKFFFYRFSPFRSNNYIKAPASFWKEFIINQSVRDSKVDISER